MNQFKYFEQEGSVYRFKPQYIVKIVIAVIIAALTWLFYFKLDAPIFASIVGLLGIMVVITLFTDKFEIDTNRKEINLRQGIYMQSRNIPFDKFINFEMLTMTTNFIRSGVHLNLNYYNDKGKEKVMKVAQSMSKMHIQKIINEVDEILGDERNQN